MGKKKTIARVVIPEVLNGKKIIEVLRDTLQLPNRQIKKFIATRGLFLNGHAVHSERRVTAGQELLVKLPMDEQIKVEPISMRLAILYEDSYLLAINKPTNINVHNTRPGEAPALVNGVAYYLQKQGISVTPRPVHRLDRDASGIVLFAKTSAVQTKLSQLWHTEKIIKTYWALVQGCIDKPGAVDLPIAGKKAVTRYLPLEIHKNCTELSVSLETGRTHQIRIHLQQIGHPIIGDIIFNPDSPYKKTRLCLHASQLSLAHPHTGEILLIKAPAPDWEPEIAALLNEPPVHT